MKDNLPQYRPNVRHVPPPPPYRAPPRPFGTNFFTQLNNSEPNINAMTSSGQRRLHNSTITGDVAVSIQDGLRSMLNNGGSDGISQNKHATFDSGSQSVALQHLRNSYKLGHLNPSESYNTSRSNLPPQIPPKPGLRMLTHSNDVEILEAELNHILQQQNGEDRFGASTPPLPPLSPETIPLFDHDTGTFKQIAEDSSKNKELKDKSVACLRQLEISKDIQTLSECEEEETNCDEDDLSTTIEVGDAASIRRQLDGLESMYTEVLKMLGLRKYGRTVAATANGSTGRHLPLDLLKHSSRKLYGSLSSLPSVSSIGSRHYRERHRKDEGVRLKRGVRRASIAAAAEKAVSKRFQRLESHVVTLARSVAHLSSEIRSQSVLTQEIEALRIEFQNLQKRRGMQGGYVDPQNFFPTPKLSPKQASRVKKLTKFFGDEPPLLRLFFKELGYEKYASLFEEAKVGLLELPYLSEESLAKLGVPLGPRVRILEEAKASCVDKPNYSVYIV